MLKEIDCAASENQCIIVFDLYERALEGLLPPKERKSLRGVPPSQWETDGVDAFAPLHDKLTSKSWATPLWWLQELWFIGYYNQVKQQKSVK